MAETLAPDAPLQAGSIVGGRVTNITRFGAFVALPGGKSGMVHISELANTFVREVTDYVHVGDMVRVMVLAVGADGKISLSVKRAQAPVPMQSAAPAEYRSRRREAGGGNFEDMMSHFKRESDDKLSDLKRAGEPKHGGRGKSGK